MKLKSRPLFSTPESIPVVFLTAVIIFAIFQVSLAPDFLASFHPRDNDDAMRLLSVRDLLAGQHWWDKTQYRVLPPEGLSLHWSRVIDGILAAGSLALGFFTSAEMAEKLVAAIWPSLLFLAFLGLTARAAMLARGPSAAAYAMIGAALLPALNINFFAFGRVDHHNVQMVCMIGMLGSLLVDTKHRNAGYAAGAFAAISISVGLEMLPFIAVCALWMTVSFLLTQYGARERLLAFGMSFGALSSLLFPVEVAPLAWPQLQCDRFALPAWSVAVGTTVFTYVVVLLVRDVRGFAKRLGLTLLFAACVAAALYPIVSGCLAGPFATVPEHLRSDIIANILENTAASELIRTAPQTALAIYLPMLLLLPFLIFGPRGEGGGLVAVFLLLGLAGALFQMRATIWGMVVLPLGFGLVMDQIINTPWKKYFKLFKLLFVLALSALFLYPPLVNLVAPIPPDVGRSQMDSACNRPEDIRALRDLPRSLALTPLGLSVPILFYTAHSVTSAPYHTRPAALGNGTRFHLGTPEELLAGMDRLGANIVVVCKGSQYGTADSAGSRLAAGESLPGLQDLDLGESRLRVLFQPVEVPEVVDPDLLRELLPELPADAAPDATTDAPPALPADNTAAETVAPEAEAPEETDATPETPATEAAPSGG